MALGRTQHPHVSILPASLHQFNANHHKSRLGKYFWEDSITIAVAPPTPYLPEPSRDGWSSPYGRLRDLVEGLVRAEKK